MTKQIDQKTFIPIDWLFATIPIVVIVALWLGSIAYKAEAAKNDATKALDSFNQINVRLSVLESETVAIRKGLNLPAPPPVAQD